MPGTRWGGIIISGLVMAITLSSCNALVSQSPPTPEPVLADCFIYYHLTAWEDLNADGIQDDGEGPLAGVEFRIKGPYAHSIAGGKGITGPDGSTTIDIWTPGGCLEDEAYAIDAVPPTGYLPSIGLPLSVEGDSGSYDYAVGFYPDAVD